MTQPKPIKFESEERKMLLELAWEELGKYRGPAWDNDYPKRLRKVCDKLKKQIEED